MYIIQSLNLISNLQSLHHGAGAGVLVVQEGG